MLTGKQIAVVVTGGIAAYKVPGLVRSLIKAGASVRVALTPAAERFVTAETLEVLTKYPVLREGAAYPDSVGHIALADWADLSVVVPATANSLGKVAQGLADNEALSSLLANQGSIVFVPAMNHKMWANPAVQRNVARLRADGHYVLEPGFGFLAEGYEGKGRMPEIEEIHAGIEAFFACQNLDQPLDLTGQRLVISAGGTEEPIDPVRYLSNRSSGKMGTALAHVALLAGAQVTLVQTPSAQNLPVLPGITTRQVTTAQELYTAMHEEIQSADILVMAAAVSDYRAAQAADQKIKKQDQDQGLRLELAENPDILASLPKDKAYVIGFAAETQRVVDYARQKLEKKGAQMIVANDVSQAGIGFASEDNAVQIVTPTDVLAVAKQSKYGIAAHILAQALKERE
ncbi:bifunctional phosphopantothenoylcysteine decarboxylase/phosphopantothenate--cysteine ligase CoaBC [Aerococcus sp. UMB7834]|uniref:bifunctional phosphopantothenoylcysteine decarboxylase/phosphopantothenate--cysteine ligase CoaBC n=1 Tax=Aerococcus sp. UMB7834 TaxID=3046342 RepID=UPI00254C7DBA|nr:bifunctional phosphopantothenoylcysteine decarboxylase/phosphopantothenate--cysteine ligase CoaBC [Aerococcus sp. UMB7834]MDK6805499.1 bifunctional phosphopantothenoylcysteine decarboxylase/phosphopantothenate--cysteine ligase CoaBC [Aerococcus sp. UMB7834]